MATKSKHRKNHKQKVQARKNRLASEKAHAQKQQREFILDKIAAGTLPQSALSGKKRKSFGE